MGNLRQSMTEDEWNELGERVSEEKESIKLLERDVVNLQNEQTALIKEKWRLRSEINKQKALIEHLRRQSMEEKERKSAWQKVAAVLAAVWALFISLFHIERK
jgi:predicted  nucleic acid-binding Zn-ribbon protein